MERSDFKFLRKLKKHWLLLMSLVFTAPCFASSNMLQAMLGASAACVDLAADWTPKYGNIVAYWKMNGLNGSIPDGTSIPGLNYTVQASNANGSGMSYVNGKLGQAIFFDGVDDSITVSAATPVGLDLSNFSFVAWIKNPTANPSLQSLISAGLQNNNKGYLIQLLFGAISVQRMIAGNNEKIQTTSTTLLPANTWTHVAIVVNTTSVRIYVNGSPAVTTGSWTAAINSYAGAGFYLGKRADGIQLWNGEMDDVALWNTSLTPTEVLGLYNKQSCGN